MNSFNVALSAPAACLGRAGSHLAAAAISKPAARKAFVNGMKTADRESANNAPKIGRLITYALNVSNLWI